MTIIKLSKLIILKPLVFPLHQQPSAAAAAKSLQSCPTLCNPIEGSPPGSPVPGILQARTLEWVAISFSNAWKGKGKVKSLSRVWLLATHGLQPTRLLYPWGFPGKSTAVGCHRLLRYTFQESQIESPIAGCASLRTNKAFNWNAPSWFLQMPQGPIQRGEIADLISIH